MTCLVTGTLRNLSGEALPATTVRFERQGVVGQDGDVVVPLTVSATSDAAGEISVILYPGTYAASIENAGARGRFAVGVPDAAEADFADLIRQMPDLTPSVLAECKASRTAAADSARDAEDSAEAAAGAAAAAGGFAGAAAGAADAAAGSAEDAAASAEAAAGSASAAGTAAGQAAGSAQAAAGSAEDAAGSAGAAADSASAASGSAGAAAGSADAAATSAGNAAGSAQAAAGSASAAGTAAGQAADSAQAAAGSAEDAAGSAGAAAESASAASGSADAAAGSAGAAATSAGNAAGSAQAAAGSASAAEDYADAALNAGASAELRGATGTLSAALGQMWREVERLSVAQESDAVTTLALFQLLSLIGQISRQGDGGRVALTGGTLADPALRIGTIGIYSAAANTLSVSISGVERLRVTAAGITVYGAVTQA